MARCGRQQAGRRCSLDAVAVCTVAATLFTAFFSASIRTSQTRHVLGVASKLFISSRDPPASEANEANRSSSLAMREFRVCRAHPVWRREVLILPGMERAESSPIGVLPLRIRIDGQFVLILTQESEDCVQHGTQIQQPVRFSSCSVAAGLPVDSSTAIVFSVSPPAVELFSRRTRNLLTSSLNVSSCAASPFKLNRFARKVAARPYMLARKYCARPQ